MTRLKTVCIRNVRDAPLPLALPPNTGGSVVTTLPAGQYEMRPQLDGRVQVVRMDTDQTADDTAAILREVNRLNRQRWNQPDAAS